MFNRFLYRATISSPGGSKTAARDIGNQIRLPRAQVRAPLMDARGGTHCAFGDRSRSLAPSFLPSLLVRWDGSKGRPSLHTGEVQGSIPCAPTIPCQPPEFGQSISRQAITGSGRR
jgi:hypothetical protein